MKMDLTQNYFELFGLPVQFGIDTNQLADRFRELQTRHHPDKYATADSRQQLMAVQATSFINEAHATLRDKRLRARYLLSLQGVDFSDETDTSNDPEYLMQQMELRESIENAQHAEDPLDELEVLRRDVRERKSVLENEFVSSYDVADYPAAKQAVLKMRFCERIADEIRRIEERLEDELI